MSKVLDSAIAYHKAEIKKLESVKEKIKEQYPLNGFNIGCKVRVGPPKPPIIFSGGVREGFPETIIGQHGKVIGFDKKTMSCLKIKIEVAGKVYVGNPDELFKES